MGLEYRATIDINECFYGSTMSSFVIVWIKLTLIKSSFCITDTIEDYGFEWWEENVYNECRCNQISNIREPYC